MQSRKNGIVQVAYYYDPKGAIGALRPRRFHRYLSELGYPSYVIGAVVNRDESDPHVVHIPDKVGELWERRAASLSSGRPLERLTLRGQVERFIRKTAMPGHSGWYWSREVAQHLERLVRTDPGITTVMSSFPPMGAPLAAWQFAKRAAIRWIADFRDPFATEVPPQVKWCQDYFERAFLTRADAIIANTEAVATYWRRRYPAHAEKIHVIWNGYDPKDEVTPLPAIADGYRRIVHTGNLYTGRNANAIIAALARLRSRSAPGVEAIRIVLAGPVAADADIDLPLYERAVKEGWLEFHRNAIPKQVALQSVREADGLLLLQPQSAIQVPAKLFEYTSIGRPILALAPANSSIEWILEKSGLPYVCVHPEDPQDIAENKIIEFLRFPNDPRSANEWFRHNFDARKQTGKLAEIIERINYS